MFQTLSTAIARSSRSVAFQAQTVPEFLQETVSQVLAFLPRLVGAILILLVGWVVGRVVAAVIRRLADAVDIDDRARDTPVASMAGPGGVDRALGKIGAYYVYFLAVLAAADALAIDVLSAYVSEAATYLPAFIAGLVILVLGFIVADFVADVIQRAEGVAETAYARAFATGVRLFLYFTVLVIALSTMGVDVRILYILARAVAYGFGAAIAIGVGLALGLGGRDYVADNVDRWFRRAREGSPRMSDEPTSGADD
ncbi:mechanosensitive ion channel family protein [Halomarina ordinaria]|uniref:Mechanosensitive ion channel n=1 Tax=Halomarina ordinaria TaxID=3033939 RepID=A0ABD5U510_9EURY|nr:hypothetical protein [Halomarina sp. PSRA2]